MGSDRIGHPFLCIESTSFLLALSMMHAIVFCHGAEISSSLDVSLSLRTSVAKAGFFNAQGMLVLII